MNLIFATGDPSRAFLEYRVEGRNRQSREITRQPGKTVLQAAIDALKGEFGFVPDFNCNAKPGTIIFWWKNERDNSQLNAN